MSVIKQKQQNMKRTKQTIMNYLISFSLIIIMVVISLPKMVLAQVMGSTTSIPNTKVKLPNTEYTESAVDLTVKVLGGNIQLKRTWANGRWYLNTEWADLRFIADPLDNSIKTIDRAGVLYERTGNDNLYLFDQVYIKKTDTGWNWYDRQGNWINYDQAGRVTEYGNRNHLKATFVFDNEGRRIAIKDYNGEQMFSFTYDTGEKLTTVQNKEGHTVNYQWQGDRLIKVIDVLGNEWRYGYDAKGQLNQRTEPDGGIINISYNSSVNAPKPAMVSGKHAGKIEQTSVVTTSTAKKDTKVAQVGKIIDKTGAVTLWNVQYSRTALQYTVTIQDPQGKKTVSVFDKKGKKLSSTVNGVLKQQFKRDTQNNILNIINQRGLITSVQYNQLNQPIKVTYPNGATESFSYDNKLGQIISYTSKLGNVTTWQYDSKGNPTKIIQAQGKPEQRVITKSYDNYGQPITISYGEGDQAITLKASYDKYGNLQTLTDANNHSYQYSYNLLGEVTSATNPLNAKWSISYDAAGRVIESKDPLNHNTTYQTDSQGRIIQITNPLGDKTQYSYEFNKDGWLLKKTDAQNQTTSYYYDVLSRLTKTVSSSGLETKKNYDQSGRFKQQLDPAGNQISLEYGTNDLEGLVVKIHYPTFSETYNYNLSILPTEINYLLNDSDKLTVSISYDPQENPVSVTDPANYITQRQYNLFGEQQKHIDPLGAETTQQWDTLGNLIKVIDAKGHPYQMAYDNNGNLVKGTKALGNDVSYRYDAANQLIEQQDAEGNLIYYQYDQAGRLVTESYSKVGQTNTSQTITYRYNDANQLIEVIQTGDTNSHFVYILDTLGRVIKANITYGKGNNKITKTLQYSYTPEGDLATITYPDNSVVSYSYQQGLLKQTLLPNGETITWDGYQWQQPTQVSFPHGIKKYQYDALQRPVEISVETNDQQQIKRQYRYDKTGNITEQNAEQGITQYQYDPLDRLISAVPNQVLQQQGLPVEGYSYDAIHNRIGSVNQPGEWQYNDKNQLIAWGKDLNQTTLTYTANGHVASETKGNQIFYYTYNTADRLTTVKKGNTVIASYQYDPYGRRISKTANGTTTYYLYTNEGLIAELDEQGNLQVAYGWQPNTQFGTSPLWQANLTADTTLSTANYQYLHADQLGTVQLATNSKGQITWQGNAETFGKTILKPTNQITMNLRFPGQYYDQETGLHYNYFRDYNPNLGRYNESDPTGLEGGINTFAYSYNNPLVYDDPYGLWWWGHDSYKGGLIHSNLNKHGNIDIDMIKGKGDIAFDNAFNKISKEVSNNGGSSGDTPYEKYKVCFQRGFDYEDCSLVCYVFDYVAIHSGTTGGVIRGCEIECNQNCSGGPCMGPRFGSSEEVENTRKNLSIIRDRMKKYK